MWWPVTLRSVSLDSTLMGEKIQRRTLLKSGAWAVPVFAVAIAAPAHAASGDLITNVTASYDDDYPNRVLLILAFDPAPTSFVAEPPMFTVDGNSPYSSTANALTPAVWEVFLVFAEPAAQFVGKPLFVTIPGYEPANAIVDSL